MNAGILIIRLVIGLSFMGHGAQKLFGWFGGHGLKGTGGFFESIGIKPGYQMALLAGLAEFIGGALFALGLFTPLAAVLIAGTMVVAIVKVHGSNGFGLRKTVMNIILFCLQLPSVLLLLEQEAIQLMRSFLDLNIM